MGQVSFEKPADCQAVAIEETDELTENAHTNIDYVIEATLEAVCGDRGPVFTHYKTTKYNRGNVNGSRPRYDKARNAALENLSCLVGAMCIGCPNKDRTSDALSNSEA